MSTPRDIYTSRGEQTCTLRPVVNIGMKYRTSVVNIAIWCFSPRRGMFTFKVTKDKGPYAQVLVHARKSVIQHANYMETEEQILWYDIKNVFFYSAWYASLKNILLFVFMFTDSTYNLNIVEMSKIVTFSWRLPVCEYMHIVTIQIKDEYSSIVMWSPNLGCFVREQLRL